MTDITKILICDQLFLVVSMCLTVELSVLIFPEIHYSHLILENLYIREVQGNQPHPNEKNHTETCFCIQGNQWSACSDWAGLTFRPSVPSNPLWPLSPWRRRYGQKSEKKHLIDDLLVQKVGKASEWTWEIHLKAFGSSFTLYNNKKKTVNIKTTLFLFS